jgi:hypothetical protein
MEIRRITLLAGLSMMPLAAAAADDAGIRALREEIARMRDTYEKRIDALEQRLARAEARATSAAPAEAAPVAVAAPVAPAPAASGPTGGGANAFNPNVSLILSGLYSNLSKDPAGYRIAGFHLPSAVLGENTSQRGFSLAESELGIAANIDPMFYGAMAFAVHPDDSVTTEEAFIQTTSLPQGFTLKAGRWFSGIGYLNEQHAHAWDFVDAPLAYTAFLGGQFNNDGLQLRWLAPTDTFVELGAEVGRGAAYPGTGRNKNGSGASAVFAHVGDDVGESSSWRAGMSYLTTSPQGRQWDDIDAANATVTNSLNGSSRLWIADGIWRWSPNGNATSRSFKLQGEYLRRVEDGTVTYRLAAPGSYAATQSGWYLQGIYQFEPYWRVGLRTERLDAGSVDYGSNNLVLLRPDYKPARNTLMFDYNPSEFSRVRLQFAQDKSRQGVTDNQVFVQYQMSLGAHGAHKF